VQIITPLGPTEWSIKVAPAGVAAPDERKGRTQPTLLPFPGGIEE